MDGYIEFQNSVTTNLTTLIDISKIFSEKVFYNNQQPIKYPYLTLSDSELDITDDKRQDIMYTINIWDNKYNLTELEQLTSDIVRLFNYKYENGTNMSWHCYKTTRQKIPDPDKEIKRREIRLHFKVYLKDIIN